MDSGLESARNRRRVSLDDGYCDITSLSLRRRGRYDFDLAFHGCFVPPAPHIMNSTPIEQPGQGGGAFATIGLDQDSPFGGIGGLRAIFLNGVRRTVQVLDVQVAASSKTNGQNEDFELVPDAALDANFELDFDFPSQVETAPLPLAPERQDRLYDTAFNDPFLNNFPQEILNDILRIDIPGQGIDFLGRIETNPSAASASTEMNLSSSQFDQGAPNNVFGMDIHGQETDFSGSLGTNPNVPSASPETSFSSNDFDQDTPNDSFSIDFPGQEIDFSNSLETNPNTPSASQETSFSAYDFDQDNLNENCALERPGEETNFPHSQGTYPNIHSASQQTSSSNDFNLIPIPSTPSPSSQAATPSRNNSSPDRHSCHHCNSTFKRQADLKRHSKVHFPGQRKFHCWQLGCERNGRRGFYRRDKLKDHEKQAHGF
jgi:hypothetical protein